MDAVKVICYHTEKQFDPKSAVPAGLRTVVAVFNVGIIRRKK